MIILSVGKAFSSYIHLFYCVLATQPAGTINYSSVLSVAIKILFSDVDYLGFNCPWRFEGMNTDLVQVCLCVWAREGSRWGRR